VVACKVTTDDRIATGSESPCWASELRPRSSTVRRTAIALALVVALVGLALTATTARADPTDSILTYGCDPPLPRGPANCSIWHTSPVSLRWTLVDPTFTPVLGTDCDTTVITDDTPGTDVTCAVQDAGLTLVQKTVKLRVDKTPPSVTGATPDRAADRAGWWNHAVQWAFAGDDATSGLAGCDTVTYSGPDSSAGDVAGDCRDVAGNAATGRTTVKYDATAPTVSGATPERPADRVGWWNHAVKWAFSGNDATSGVASCDTVTYSGPDDASGDVAGDCHDVAGNAGTGHAAIKYDGTPPTVTGATPARAPDGTGWWNHPIKWTFAGSDATSGLASCDTVNYPGPDDASGDVEGDCRDVAGNAATGHATVKYDSTPPIVTGATPDRTADRAGWWNHAVKWAFAGSDATSGIAGCDTVTYSGPDVLAATVSGACHDMAGNVETAHSGSFKYDDTAPTISGATPERPADRAGWWNHAVKWTFAGSDATSGLTSCDTVTYSGPASATGDVNGDCRDVAGNAATGHAPIKYDDAPPTLTAPTPARPPDHGGWWTHPVTIDFGGSDATSGIASCDSVSYAGPDDPAADVQGGCRDVAGNVASGHAAIQYDSTAPAITSITPDRPPDRGGWWNHPVQIVFAGSDATSGIAGCDTVTYAGPDDPGRAVTGSCVDAAGNSKSLNTTVKYDATQPTITSVAAERPPDHDGWWNHPVTVAFSGTDAMSGIASCDTIVYSGPDELSADVTGGCVDQAGNVADGRLGIKYDAQPPTLSALPAEVGSNEAVIHWSTSSDTVLTEVSRSPGIGGSPASTVYSGIGQSFSDPGVKNDVTYTYSIRASDEAANVASTTVTITPRAPTVPTPDAAPTPVPTPKTNLPPPRTAVTLKPVQPPLLKWRRVKGATYYNVQLYRGNRKILSVWPKSTRLQLQLRWRFGGRLMRLTPARYDWYVWPGFGTRAERRYGRRAVHRRFTFNPSEAAALFGLSRGAGLSIYG
jgi:large repetitive protein